MINLQSFKNISKICIEKAYTEGIYADTPANRKLGRVGMTYQAYAEKVKSSNKEEKETKDEDAEEKEEKMKYKQLHSDILASTGINLPKSYVLSSEGNALIREFRGGYEGQKHITKMENDLVSKGWKMITQSQDNGEPTGNSMKDTVRYKSPDGNYNYVSSCFYGPTKESNHYTSYFIKKEKNGNLVDDSDLKNLSKNDLDKIIEYSNSDEEGLGIKVSKDATNEEKKVAIANFYSEAAENNPEYLNEIIEDALSDYTRKDTKEENKNGHYEEFVDEDTGEIVKVWMKDPTKEELALKEKQDKENKKKYNSLVMEERKITDEYFSLSDKINLFEQQLKSKKSEYKQLQMDQEEEVGSLYQKNKEKEAEKLAQSYGEELNKLNEDITIISDNLSKLKPQADKLLNKLSSIHDEQFKVKYGSTKNTR